MTLEKRLDVEAVLGDRLPIPEVMDGRALKDHDKLAGYPPQECDGTHYIQRPLEPDLCRHLGGMLGEDARIEEEDGEFDHSDCRSIEVLKDVKDVVPLLRRVRTSHCLMLAKVKVRRCPSDQPLHRIPYFLRSPDSTDL